MSEVAVRVEGLRKTFGAGRGERVAVEHLSFELPKGGCLAIVGESGCGKTTSARCLVGLERPTAGRIEVGGRPRRAGHPGVRERRRRATEVQMVFQDPYGSLNPRLTAAAILDQAVSIAQGRLSSRDRAARVTELFAQVELPASLARNRPRQLSGGQRQRLAIARALAADPAVLVLDEAVAALDVSIQAQILNLLADLREASDLSLVFISHDLAAVRQVADDVVVMRRGVVVESGTTDAVLSHPTEAYTRRLLEAVPRPGWNPLRALPDDTLPDGTRPDETPPYETPPDERE